VLLGAGFFWLRDSEVVAVRKVTITGVSSSQEARVRDALRRAALDMTTLHVRRDDLKAAVASFASVGDVRAQADFPDALRIEVVERLPAALLAAGGERIPVSAGGLLLRGVRPESRTPIIEVDRLPVGARLDEPRARAIVSVIAAAPGELRGRIERAQLGPRGIELDLRDGPDLIFGARTRLDAKWAAATRVMADSSAQGATYLDLRLPEWTAAGGLGGVEQPAPSEADPSGQAVPEGNPQP
jgi:cell division protein FtsQ